MVCGEGIYQHPLSSSCALRSQRHRVPGGTRRRANGARGRRWEHSRRRDERLAARRVARPCARGRKTRQELFFGVSKNKTEKIRCPSGRVRARRNARDAATGPSIKWGDTCGKKTCRTRHVGKYGEGHEPFSLHCAAANGSKAAAKRTRKVARGRREGAIFGVVVGGGVGGGVVGVVVMLLKGRRERPCESGC
jgi:hypothetical protein